MRRNNVIDVVYLLLHLLFLIPNAAAQTDDTAPLPAPDFSLNPTMDIIMIVVVGAFFSLGFYSVYALRHAQPRTHGGTTSDTDLLAWNRRLGGGIGDELIRTFPTFQYSAVKINNGELECAICLNEFEEDETLRLLPKCSHVFHAECVDAWLSSHSTCPVCRANLLPRPGETLTSNPVQIFDPESGHGEPSGRQDPEAITRSPEVNVAGPSAWTNQNPLPRAKSTGLRFGRLFPRSHSTGHTLVQNYERFTLKLPEGIRSQIMNSSINLNRARSLVVLPRVRSERRGYRSGSTGSGLVRSSSQYAGETRPDRWGLRMVPPFISRTGSVRSTGGGKEAVDGNRSSRNPVDQ